MHDVTTGSLVAKQYRVVGRLDQGGMGVVYRVEDTLDGDRVLALKFIRPDRDTPQARRRFIEEASILKDAHHPNVVEYVEFPMRRGVEPFLVTEFVEGGTLHQLLDVARSSGQVPLPLPSGLGRQLALELMRQVADGLAYVHARGVTHRDLKPSNLLLTTPPSEILATGRAVVKIADFGVASSDDDGGPPLTVAGSFVGTVTYASPEHLRQVMEFRPDNGAPWRRSAEDERAGDVFALGLILYEVWMGHHLVQEVDLVRARDRVGSVGATLEALITAVRRLDEHAEGVKATYPELRLLVGLLDEDPRARPTAREAADRLAELCGLKPSAVAPDPGGGWAEDDVGGRGTRDGGRLRSSVVNVLFGRRAPPDREPPARPMPSMASIEAPAPPAPRRTATAAAVMLVTLGVGIGLGRVLPPRGGGEAAMMGGAGAPPMQAGPAPVSVESALVQEAAPDALAGADRIVARPTSTPAPPTPAPPAATPAPATPAAATPVRTQRVAVAEAPAAEAIAAQLVPCKADVLAEAAQGLLAGLGELGPPLRKKPVAERCWLDGGRVWYDAEATVRTEVYAPVAGNLRWFESRHPDQAFAYCAVITAPAGPRLKLCGLSKKVRVLGKEDVLPGVCLGVVDAAARLTLTFLPPSAEPDAFPPEAYDVRMFRFF